MVVRKKAECERNSLFFVFLEYSYFANLKSTIFELRDVKV